MSIIGGSPIVDSKRFQRAMVFIDGTNLFWHLRSHKITVPSLVPLPRYMLKGRQVIRNYLYTIEHHYNEAKKIYGPSFFDEVRVEFGEGIPINNSDV